MEAMDQIKHHDHPHVWTSTWIKDFLDPQNIPSVLDKVAMYWETEISDLNDKSHIFGPIFFMILKFLLPTVIVVGLLGNISSAIIFLGTTLRKFSYSHYFAGYLITQSCQLLFLFLAWLDSNQYVSFSNIPGYCPSIVFFSAVSNCLSVWFIAGASTVSYFLLMKPSGNRETCSPFQAKIVIFALTWICFAEYSAFFFFAIIDHRLQEVTGANVIRSIEFLSCTILPFIITLTCVIKIVMEFRRAAESARQIQEAVYNTRVQLLMARRLMFRNTVSLETAEEDEEGILEDYTLETSRLESDMPPCDNTVTPMPKESSAGEIAGVSSTPSMETCFSHEPTNEVTAEHNEPEETQENVSGRSVESDQGDLSDENVIYVKPLRMYSEERLVDNRTPGEVNTTTVGSVHVNQLEEEFYNFNLDEQRTLNLELDTNNSHNEESNFDSYMFYTPEFATMDDQNPRGESLSIDKSVVAKMVVAVASSYFVMTVPCYLMRAYIYITYEYWSNEVPDTVISTEQVFMGLQYVKLCVNVFLFTAYSDTFRYFYFRYFKLSKLARFLSSIIRR